MLTVTQFNDLSCERLEFLQVHLLFPKQNQFFLIWIPFSYHLHHLKSLFQSLWTMNCCTIVPNVLCHQHSLSALGPKEKLERYHQDLAADEYLSLFRSRKFSSLCKDNTEIGLLEKRESSPIALEINDSEFEGVPCMYKPTSKRQERKTVHSQKKSNEKSVKDKSLRTTVKDGNTSKEEILKPTEIKFVNSGKRKMIIDCNHKCPKAVGFSYPGVVLHCFECKSEKKKRK